MTTEQPEVNYRFTRPLLYRKQRDAFFNDSRYSFIEASTKSGKTTAAICWLLEQAVMHGKRGYNYWWVAPIRTQAKIAYDRMKRYCPQGSFTSNESDLFIVLFNGAKIWFKSGDHPDGLYGDDVHAVVIDEASRCKDKSWDAVRTTLTATQGKARLIANVKDRRNWFYLLCRQAQAGNLNTSEYHTINADDAVKAGVIPAKEIEDAKAMLPEAAFLALYYNQPADDGGNPFGLKAIRDIVIEDFSFNDPRAFGWDLAKSVDFTVGIGLDDIGHVCRFERFQKRWDATEAIIVDINGRTPALIDSTGVGDPVVERIQKRLPNIVGFKFSQSSKQQLMEGLAVAIQQKLIRIPDGDIVKELESFEYEFTRTGVKYSCPAGLHDDCVMALALAVKQYLEPQIIPRARWL